MNDPIGPDRWEIDRPGGGRLSANGTLPENPSDYPEISMFGDLPVWGLYLRHVNGIKLKHVDLSVVHPDARPMTRVDDADGVTVMP